MDSFVIVSFFWEKLYSTVHIRQYYCWLTCYVCARLCQCFGQGVAIFGVINRVPATTSAHNVFCYSAVAHILTPSVNLASRPESSFKNKCRARAMLELVIWTSGRVQASTWGPFTTLCGYVGRGKQWEIKRIHSSPTNIKNRLKSFCEVGYANFRPNVFPVGKTISVEILVGLGLRAWCPVACKRFVALSKKRKFAKEIFIVFVTLSVSNKTSNRAVTYTYKMHEIWSVLLYEWYACATNTIQHFVHSNWQLW